VKGSSKCWLGNEQVGDFGRNFIFLDLLLRLLGTSSSLKIERNTNSRKKR